MRVSVRVSRVAKIRDESVLFFNNNIFFWEKWQHSVARAVDFPYPGCRLFKDVFVR